VTARYSWTEYGQATRVSCTPAHLERNRHSTRADEEAVSGRHTW
jgi:hypothetical protein